jgi:hypothetical protein
MMKNNPLKKLEKLGQSIWLDYIRRDLIISGELRRLIEEDGLRGMTSNPSIFEKAIAESHIYDQEIHDLALEKKNVKAIYELSARVMFRVLLTNSELFMTRRTVKMDMSAWRSTLIWHMTQKAQLRKPVDCGLQ